MAIPENKNERTCVGCFQKKSRNELLAVTKEKNGLVAINVDGKISGRSAYLCRNKQCISKASHRKGKDGLEFTLKTKIAPGIWNELEKHL